MQVAGVFCKPRLTAAPLDCDLAVLLSGHNILIFLSFMPTRLLLKIEVPLNKLLLTPPLTYSISIECSPLVNPETGCTKGID